MDVKRRPRELLKVDEDFSSLVEVLEATYQLPPLPRPTHPTLSAYKEFCSGLLEGRSHAWDDALSRVQRTVRWAIAASLFLFRKRLPSSPDPENVKKFLDKVSSPAPSVDPNFQSFARSEVRRIFRKGWDRGYGKKVASATLSTSACLSTARKKGGVRASGLPHSRYSEWVNGDRDVPYNPTVRLASVLENGKERLVTIGGEERSCLKPLHGILYDHLSRQKWLLRGEATPAKFKDFTLKKGEVFVSGDYESATDNLSLEFYEFVLRETLDTCTYVPDTIREFALRSARSTISTQDGVTAHQARGQLMGNLLSFPFLCLTNYLAFRFFVGRKVPVKINGDDIVFRCRRSEARRWMEGIQSTGLTLSKGKTLVDHQFFSLNSTFFKARSSGVGYLPIVRSKALFGKPESVSAWVGQYGACVVGGSPGFKESVRRVFIRRNPFWLWRSRRSMTRGLGLHASIRFMKSMGLWDREKFYLSTPTEPVLPSPPTDVLWDTMPSGWEQKAISLVAKERRRFLREDEKRFFMIMSVKGWQGPSCPAGDKWRIYSERLSAGTYRYNPMRSRTLSKLLLRKGPQHGGVYFHSPKQRLAELLSRDDHLLRVKMARPLREYIWVDVAETPSYTVNGVRVEAVVKETRRGEGGGVRL